MIDRRRLLMTAAAGSAFAASGSAFAQAAGTGPEAAALNALFDKIFNEVLLTSPELVTMLGMDKGPLAPMKAQLDDRSQAKLEADKVEFRAYMAELDSIDRTALTGMDAVNFDTLRFFGDTAMSGHRFPYGGGFFPSPYTVSQLGGSYVSVPDFLDNQHSIETNEDAEAYLSRLDAFATALDHETERLRSEFAVGATPPDFVISKTLVQMAALLDSPAAESVMTTSLARRTAEKGLDGDWAARAERIVSSQIYPALQRQADALRAQQPTAVRDAGAWRLPDGEAYYEYGIRFYTTTNLNGNEIHEMGLEQVAELSARADELLRAQGMTQGTVGERIAALSREPRFVYPNTDEAKEELLNDLNDQIVAMQARLPEYFGRLPRSPVEVRRVPEFIEAGAPGGYYQSPALDGSRPGAYYINLRDTAEWPRWSLPTLTYHEATPGHHHQIALAQEAEGIPMLRKVLGFSAYSEGWALYAEQLADEMGVYDNDPWGRIGYLQSFLFRAARLVVDSGLHAKRWSREQGIRYMVDTLGDQESSMTTEVERYAVWPGQASSYKVGQTVWDRLRTESRAALGDRFDIRGFHDTGLAAGAIPLAVLERVIRDWTASQRA